MASSRFSRFICARAEQRALSKAQVHRDLLGRGLDLTYGAVFRWFSGETRPDLGQFRVLAFVLDLSGADLVHALTLAAEDSVVGEVRTSAEPDTTVAPAA